LYLGYQKETFYGVIEEMPAMLGELKDYVSDSLGLQRDYFNHVLLSFHSDGHNGHIETHRDLAHSAEEDGDHEGKAIIAMLNLMETRTMVFTDPAAPASFNMKTLQPDIIHTVEFGHGDMIALKPPLNQQVKHGIPQDKTTGWRCSIVLRQVTKNWVNVTDGYYKVNGDQLRIKNIKDSDGKPSEFIRQPPVSSFLNVVPLAPFEPTVWPPPLLPADDARALLMTTLGVKPWEWGPQYAAPGFSRRAGLPWWRIACDRQYIGWLLQSARSHPPCWAEFQKYLHDIMDSELYHSLDESFGTDNEKFNYIRDSLQADNLYIRSVPTKIRRTMEVDKMPDDEFVTLGKEELGGRTFDAIINMDTDGAVLFAEYVRRKVATPMNTPRTSEGLSSSSSRPSDTAAGDVPVLPALPAAAPKSAPAPKRVKKAGK